MKYEHGYTKGDFLFSYYFIFIFLNIIVTVFLKGEFKFKGVILEGWTLYAFLLFFLILVFHSLVKVMNYITSNYRLNIRQLLGEYFRSPFFFAFVVLFMYQNYCYKSYNTYVLISLYFLFFYFQYRFLKKVENNYS
jgi:hypothetical protein